MGFPLISEVLLQPAFHGAAASELPTSNATKEGTCHGVQKSQSWTRQMEVGVMSTAPLFDVVRSMGSVGPAPRGKLPSYFPLFAVVVGHAVRQARTP